MTRLPLLIIGLLATFVVAGQAPAAAFTAAQTAGCAPVVISFTDASTNAPTAWQWDFGNGSTSTLQNPSTTYFNPGTYTVTLTATNASGSNTISRAAFITIYGRPSVVFAAADSAGCAPFQTTFNDLSGAAAGTSNSSWQWDFGNGTSSTAQSPTATWPTPGNYTVTLRVTNNQGCFASLTKPAYIRITGGLQLGFSATQPSRCRTPYPVGFTNTSTGPGALSYFWAFGDGTTSTAASPSHNYSTSGSYTVTLAVTSSSGCTDTLRRPAAVVIDSITTRFSSPDSICAEAPVSFTNTSTPAPQSSLWDFGDGTTATAINPTTAYTTPGTYTVRLRNTYNYCTDTATRTIRVLPKPVAAFSNTPSISCQPPLTVAFNNTSTGAVSYRWDFGDGGTSTQAAPSHTYTTYGSFTVTLIVTTASGCTDTLIQPAAVRIQRPGISFPTLPQLGCVPYTTTFSAGINTLDNVTSYLWAFGDGATSTQATPTHTYPVQGTYTVSLTITTSTGCTETYSLPSAINTGRVPIIDFTAAPNPACAFSTVQFTSSVSEGDTWLWNFGDGTTSTLQNPTHTYTDTGSYSVSFTATNNGCPATITKGAFVSIKPPISRFSFTNDCNNRRRFLFSDNSVGATGWLWAFGDGTTSTAQNPTHVYAAFGSYTVTLTVTNDTCSHSSTQTVRVINEQPTFTADRTVACRSALIMFTPVVNNSANITSFFWNFNNGSTATDAVTQALFTQAGNYTIELITTDIYGCRDTVPRVNYIRINGPTAAFTIPVDNGCRGYTATFGNQSTSDGINPIVSWVWKYGDGTADTLTTATPPTHTYNTVGTFIPRLIVTDALGCKDSVDYPSVVKVTRPTAAFASADTANCLGSTVAFTNTSAAQGYTSNWSFGDGTTSTLQNPTHVYADTGSYTVTLAITDNAGCSDTTTLNNFIRIQRTIAAFTPSDSLGGCVPFEVRFSNTSQFYTTSTWDLGVAGSTANNPSQVYNTAGSYAIQLVVTGRGGCTDTATRTIQIFNASATTFSYSPFAGCKPLQFTGVVNSPADLDFIWDFGDGGSITTTADTTVYTYNSFGNFVPKLLLSDSGNCLIPLIGADTVRIVGVTAGFGWDRRLFCDSGTVTFTDSTTFNDPITSYNWSFGDGGTSAATSPSHSYTTPGYYTVALTLQTQSGCRDTFRVDSLVKVVESPSIRIAGDTIICRNDFVTYQGLFNRPDTSVVRWNWQFPNSATASVQNPSPQQFLNDGSFFVQAIATNSSGCIDTADYPLLVNPLPTISIASPQVTPLGTPILLPAVYAANVIDWSWSPTTGLNCSDCPQPEAMPKFNTLYTVTATDANGCVDTASVQVIVLCQGTNVFVPNTFSPNGDGNNDVFYVRGRGLARVKSLRIYNRWGQTVFEKINFNVNDASAGWDGRYKGQLAAPDVYIYQVDVFCDNSESIRFDGSVSLIR